MNTTDEIMALARSYRNAQPGLATTITFSWLETAINELVKQAAWAHHTPKLLSDADAAADLAGVARPGAEQWLESVMSHVQVLASTWALVGSRFDDGTCLDDFVRKETELLAMLYTAPPQASQPAQDAVDAERYRWLASKAVKDTAYDRYGDGAHWSIGFFSDDGRLTLDAAIAAQKGKP